jgi:hypothetical protein
VFPFAVDLAKSGESGFFAGACARENTDPFCAGKSLYYCVDSIFHQFQLYPHIPDLLNRRQDIFHDNIPLRMVSFDVFDVCSDVKMLAPGLIMMV